jgi:HEAT repeat protein
MNSIMRTHTPAGIVLAVVFFTSCAHEPKEERLYGGRTLVEWQCQLHSSEAGDIEEASVELRRIARDSPETVRAVVEALRETDLEDNDRGAAAAILGEFAREDRAIVRVLVEALKDGSWFVRGEAGDALWKAAPADSAQLSKLTEDLKSPDADVRLHAALAVGKMQKKDSGTMMEWGKRLSAAGEAMRRALRDPDCHVRHYAALAFAGMSIEPKGAFDDLMGLVNDDHLPARVEAVNALRLYESRPREVIPRLIRLLEAPQPEIRRAAAMALWPFRSEAREAIGRLTTALGDTDSEVRAASAFALGTIGPAAHAAIPALIVTLADPDVDVRRHAAEALGDIATAKPDEDERDVPNPAAVANAVSALARALGDTAFNAEDEMGMGSLARMEAVEALGKIGPRAALVVPAIANALRDEDLSVRRSAAKALGQIGAGARPAIPALTTALADPEKDVRVEAVKALCLIGDPSEGVLAALQKALGDADDEVANESAGALAQFSRPGLPVLLESLGDKNPRVRARAARGLGLLAGRRSMECGGFSDQPCDEEDFEDETSARPRLTEAESRRTVSALLAAIEDADAAVRRAACGALAGMGSVAAAAVPAFTRALDDADPVVRRLAAWGLEGIGPAAKDAVPRLLQLIRDARGPVRPHAIMAVGRIAPESAAAIPPLVEALEDPEYGKYAADVLSWKGETAAPALAAALRSPNPVARRHAVAALKDIGPTAAAAAGTALLEALANPDEEVRAAAAEAVEGVGPKADAAVPALIRAFQGGSDRIKAKALSALARYEEKARSAIPMLLEKLMHSDAEKNYSLRGALMNAIAAIGAGEESAKRLLAVDLDPSDRTWDASRIFLGLLDCPALALDYYRRHPGLIESIEPLNPALLRMLRRSEPAWSELKQRVIEDSRPDPAFLVALGDPRHLPIVRKQMAGASAHRLPYLKACARALGEPPDRVVRISETAKGDFRPASAWPGTDKRRMPRKRGGHGDGTVNVLITGRLRMPDGSPAVEPRFYDLNDRLLLGRRRKEPATITYDPKTGRFQFFTNVFAAFASGEGPREEGPYQTGSALVLIEARGAKPLKARFFDEMPEVEVTLGRAP